MATLKTGGLGEDLSIATSNGWFVAHIDFHWTTSPAHLKLVAALTELRLRDLLGVCTSTVYLVTSAANEPSAAAMIAGVFKWSKHGLSPQEVRVVEASGFLIGSSGGLNPTSTFNLINNANLVMPADIYQQLQNTSHPLKERMTLAKQGKKLKDENNSDGSGNFWVFD
jgi:hypothetical protein